jgi:hypothetical protein
MTDCLSNQEIETAAEAVHPEFDNINSVATALQRIHQKLTNSGLHDRETWVQLYDDVNCGAVEVEDIGMIVTKRFKEKVHVRHSRFNPRDSVPRALKSITELSSKATDPRITGIWRELHEQVEGGTVAVEVFATIAVERAYDPGYVPRPQQGQTTKSSRTQVISHALPKVGLFHVTHPSSMSSIGAFGGTQSDIQPTTSTSVLGVPKLVSINESRTRELHTIELKAENHPTCKPKVGIFHVTQPRSKSSLRTLHNLQQDAPPGCETIHDTRGTVQSESV